MGNTDLNKLCMDESDPMLKAVVQCKHGNLLQMQTSWSKSNPGRRYWSCPYYGPKNCKFFRWRDNEDVDPRSKYILPKMVNKIKELEKELAHNESIKMELTERESIDMNSVSMDLNVVEVDSSNEERRMVQRKSNCSGFNRKNFMFCIVVCVFVIFISNLFQTGNSNMELP